jgi:hypothetical protein
LHQSFHRLHFHAPITRDPRSNASDLTC